MGRGRVANIDNYILVDTSHGCPNAKHRVEALVSFLIYTRLKLTFLLFSVNNRRRYRALSVPKVVRCCMVCGRGRAAWVAEEVRPRPGVVDPVDTRRSLADSRETHQ